MPTQFKKPELAGDQFYFDYFPSRHAIGKKWVKSNAKKDGVDADIAKYNGSSSCFGFEVGRLVPGATSQPLMNKSTSICIYGLQLLQVN